MFLIYSLVPSLAFTVSPNCKDDGKLVVRQTCRSPGSVLRTPHYLCLCLTLYCTVDIILREIIEMRVIPKNKQKTLETLPFNGH